MRTQLCLDIQNMAKYKTHFIGSFVLGIQLYIIANLLYQRAMTLTFSKKRNEIKDNFTVCTYSFFKNINL